jgi:hypothetical protein
MSFIDLPINNIDDIQEDQPVPEGEYNLVIIDCKERKNESEELKGLLIICEIEGHQGAANVLHNMALPLPGDDPTKVSNKLKFIKRFVSLFKIPVNGGKLNPSDFPGKRAKAFLTQEEYNGDVSNKIKLPISK